jgi:hypothetical protein
VTVEDFANEVEAAGRQFAYIGSVTKLDETRFSVKYWLVITDDLYVQAYANTQNGTVGLALIYQGRRLYGRDCENWQWHRHPAAAPETHDFSSEGVRSVAVQEFLLETGQVLVDCGLI